MPSNLPFNRARRREGRTARVKAASPGRGERGELSAAARPAQLRDRRRLRDRGRPVGCGDHQRRQHAGQAARSGRDRPDRAAEFVGSDREAGLDRFVNAAIRFIAIGVGVLVGNALVLRLSERRARRALAPA
jgi:hypothetical protein